MSSSSFVTVTIDDVEHPFITIKFKRAAPLVSREWTVTFPNTPDLQTLLVQNAMVKILRDGESWHSGRVKGIQQSNDGTSFLVTCKSRGLADLSKLKVPTRVYPMLTPLGTHVVDQLGVQCVREDMVWGAGGWTDTNLSSVSLETTIKIHGANSLKLVAVTGGYVGGSFAGYPIDATPYKHVGMWWYGANTGALVTAIIYCPASTNSTVRFTFNDDFTGWRFKWWRLDRPTSTTGTPNLANCETFYITLSNCAGTFYMDVPQLFNDLAIGEIQDGAKVGMEYGSDDSGSYYRTQALQEIQFVSGYELYIHPDGYVNYKTQCGTDRTATVVFDFKGQLLEWIVPNKTSSDHVVERVEVIGAGNLETMVFGRGGSSSTTVPTKTIAHKSLVTDGACTSAAAALYDDFSRATIQWGKFEARMGNTWNSGVPFDYLDKVTILDTDKGIYITDARILELDVTVTSTGVEKCDVTYATLTHVGNAEYTVDVLEGTVDDLVGRNREFAKVDQRIGETISTQNLTLYAKLNEAAGTVAIDQTSNRYHGLMSGVDWIPSAVGKVAEMGLNDYIDFGTALTFAGTSNLSVGCFLNIESGNLGTVGNIFSKVGQIRLFWDGVTNAKRFGFAVTIGSTEYILYTDTNSAPTDTRLAVDATYDGAYTCIYINGVLAAKEARTGNLAASSDPIRVGKNSVASTSLYASIAELSVYKRTLSQIEIKDKYLYPSSVNVPAETVTDIIMNGLDKGVSSIVRLNGAVAECIDGNSGKVLNSSATHYTVIDYAWQRGGNCLIKKGTYLTAARILPYSNLDVTFENGVIFKWNSAGAGTVFGNNGTAGQLIDFHMHGSLTVDGNGVASTYGVDLDCFHDCSFDFRIINCTNALWIRETQTGTDADGFPWNTYEADFKRVRIHNCTNGIRFIGTASGKEITLLDFHKVRITNLTGKGIAFGGWASGISFHGMTWIALSAAGAQGVIWNDSATPTANVGDYDNSFEDLKVDPFGVANHSTTVLMKLNYTKGAVVKRFFYSNSARGQFLGTIKSVDASCISYDIQMTEGGTDVDPEESGLLIAHYKQGYRHLDVIARNIALLGDQNDTSVAASVSINDWYDKRGAQLLLRSNSTRVRATGHSHLTGSGVSAVHVDVGGAGYTVAPVVYLIGDGSGATAHAHITGGVVTSIDVDTAGTGYTFAPYVLIYKPTGGTNYEFGMSMSSDGITRLNPPSTMITKLPSSTNWRIDDNANNQKFVINDSGVCQAVQFQPTDATYGFLASDGSRGIAGTWAVAAITTLTFKNGLLVGIT